MSAADPLSGIAGTFENLDADEVILRVHEYYPDLRPATYCCIVKHRNRCKMWGIAIARDPVRALTDAFAKFREEHQGKAREKSHVWDRVPLISAAPPPPTARSVPQDIEDMLG